VVPTLELAKVLTETFHANLLSCALLQFSSLFSQLVGRLSCKIMWLTALGGIMLPYRVADIIYLIDTENNFSRTGSCRCSKSWKPLTIAIHINLSLLTMSRSVSFPF
jgi:hypothetical protein